MHSTFNIKKNLNYIKYARIRVFADPYSPVQRQNHGFLDSVLIRENKVGSVKTRNLAYFMQHCGNLMRKSK